jgi:hypothetical protein
VVGNEPPIVAAGRGSSHSSSQRLGRTIPRAALSGALQPTVLALAAIGTVFYVVRFWTVYSAGELFHRLGWDWTMFWAQAMLLRSGQASDMYEQPIVNEQSGVHRGTSTRLNQTRFSTFFTIWPRVRRGYAR